MPYSGELKVKLLALWEILSQYSDRSHPIGTNEIVSRLKEKGIPCDRRTLAQDIEALQNYGYEVMVDKKPKETQYYKQ